MMNTQYFSIALAMPFLMALVTPLAYRLMNRRFAILIPLLGAFVPFLLFLHLLPSGQEGLAPKIVSYAWVPTLSLNLVFTLDGFGLLFALLVSGMGTLIVWYGHFYMEDDPGVGRFFSYLLFFSGAMQGVCLSEHFFTLFLFWELTSISSFLLIGFWYDKEKSRAGALKALTITAGGGLVMMAGLALLGGKTGAWTWTHAAALAPSLLNQSWMTWALILIAIGAFTKSAQAPYHIWLPDAMEAPTPVSAFLHSATMVKAGIILLFRIYPIFSEHFLWFPLMTIIGMITVVVGAVLALKHTDLKAILAYSTISQLGLFVVMHGYASVETIIRSSLIFHIFIHAFYKGSLFMLVGIIDHGTHTRDINNLGFLKKYMPRTAFFVCLSAASLAGLPPFLGFLSKESAIEASLHMAHTQHGFWFVLPLAYVLSAVLTVAVAGKISLGVFFSKANDPSYLEEHHPHEASWGFLLPPALLSVAGLVFGLFPSLLEQFLYPVGMVGLLGIDTPHFSLWHGINPTLITSAVAIAGGIFVFKFRHPIQRIHENLKLSWNLNTLYEKKMNGLLDLAETFTKKYQNGSLTQYTINAIGFFVLLFLGTLFVKFDGGSLTETLSLPMKFEILVCVTICFTSLLVARMTDRIARLISLGGIGLLICTYFILRGAPDLALTGFLVEIVMFILILIIFNQLKDELPNPDSPQQRNVGIVVGILSGLSMGALVFLALHYPFGSSISPYFLKASDTLAGGLNVVNVIVVDFRGFDTLGEITVLCLAGLGVYALRHIWMSQQEKPDLPPKLKMEQLPPSQILHTISGIVFPFIIIFSLYMTLRGHNDPGGGFIGGLITAGGLILELLVIGRERYIKIIPVRGRALYMIGLILAFVTGLVPLFYGYPFLTSYVFESIHFSTAGLFDLGVYFVVVGVTIDIIDLVEMGERTGVNP